MSRILNVLAALVGFVVFTAAPVLAQIQPPEVEWEKTFVEDGDDDRAFSVQQTTDGGYVVVGWTFSFGTPDHDVYLIKTDSQGSLVWEKTFGGAGWDEGFSVQQTSDGGYIVAGETSSFSPENSDVYLIKTDATGNLMWEKVFGGASDNGGYSVQQTSDGGYIVAGFTHSFGADDLDVYLIKTDAAGNLLWQKTFGGVGDDMALSVRQTSDGSYVVAGWTSSFGAGDYDVYLIKTNANGNLEWEKTFGGIGYDAGSSVQQTTDGGYIVVGSTNSFGAGDFDVYLIKTNANGNLEWEKTFGGTSGDVGFSVQQTTDGGYIVAGETYSFGAGDGDVYLIKTNANGNLEWQMTFGGTKWDRGYSVQETQDFGYIVAGWTSSFGAGDSDVYLTLQR